MGLGWGGDEITSFVASELQQSYIQKEKCCVRFVTELGMGPFSSVIVFWGVLSVIIEIGQVGQIGAAHIANPAFIVN